MRPAAYRRPLSALTIAISLWLGLATVGALVVGKVAGPLDSPDWPFAVARVVVVAGVPSISVAVLCAVALRRGASYWVAVVVVLGFLLMFSVGLKTSALRSRCPAVWIWRC